MTKLWGELWGERIIKNKVAGFLYLELKDGE